MSISLDLSKDMYICSAEGEEDMAEFHRAFNGRILNAEMACQHFTMADDWYFDFTNQMRILYTCHHHLEGVILYECDDDGEDIYPNHRVVQCGMGESILSFTEE